LVLGAGVSAVAVGGGSHACATKRDGSLFCWGANAMHQLGVDATSGDRMPPVQVTVLADSVGSFCERGR
jgi:hypothetical protein